MRKPEYINYEFVVLLLFFKYTGRNNFRPSYQRDEQITLPWRQ